MQFQPSYTSLFTFQTYYVLKTYAWKWVLICFDFETSGHPQTIWEYDIAWQLRKEGWRYFTKCNVVQPEKSNKVLLTWGLLYRKSLPNLKNTNNLLFSVILLCIHFELIRNSEPSSLLCFIVGGSTKIKMPINFKTRVDENYITT